jgi:hypothetical protein
VRTAPTSSAGTLIKDWDVQAQMQDVQAQARITQQFGQNASNLIGNYAAQQLDQARALHEQAHWSSDPDLKQQLNAQADQIDSQWGENGTLRTAAHAVVGGLTGGMGGALGAATSTLSAPQVAQALSDAGIAGPLADTLTALAGTAVGAVAGGASGAAAAFNEVSNNYLNHTDNTQRAQAQKNRDACTDESCRQQWQAVIEQLDQQDRQSNLDLLIACAGAPTSEACRAQSKEFLGALASYATPEARADALNNPEGLTPAHKQALQSDLDVLKVADLSVGTGAAAKVAAPGTYNSDPYGMVDPSNPSNAYLVMQFGGQAMPVANVYNSDDGTYAILTPWWSRNGMNNDPNYAPGLMLEHVSERAKQAGTSVDMYTLSYAPTNGLISDIWSALQSKLGYESESVQALRSQVEQIQDNSIPVKWVVQSRAGVEFVQAAQGSSFTDLGRNSVVFDSGANTKSTTEAMKQNKNINPIQELGTFYFDAPNDLVPQVVGLRAFSENKPGNILKSLISAPCVLSIGCTESPHTHPYVPPTGE